MGQQLTPQERLVLRELADQLRREDPGLAAQLDEPAAPALVRFSPLRWPAGAYLVLAVLWLVPGVAFEVDSAIAAAMVCLGIGVVRAAFAPYPPDDLADPADPAQPPAGRAGSGPGDER